MIKRSIFVIGLLASSAAIAADSNYFYVGGNWGQARTSFDSNPGSVRGASATYDSSVGVWGAFGGYQINKYFGVEGRYITFGDTNVVVNLPGGTLITTVQIQGWGASLVGTMPVGKNFSLLGRIGETYIRQESIVTDNVWSPSFGVGLQYDFNASFIGRVEVERFTDMGDSNHSFGGKSNVWTVGLAYKF